MRRWNGWGDDAVEVALEPQAQDFLQERIGPGTPPPEAAFETVCAALAPSRLPPHRLVHTAPETRLRHAFGQSLPDWLRMCYGRVDAAPDGVAFPECDDEVRELLRYARACGAVIIPYGGGTSVCGQLQAGARGRPTLTVAMGRMRALSKLDREARLATFGAGVDGPELEARLRAHGYTLGHFPQSFEYSTLGGWIATRASGQQSLYYGRIEQLFAGGHLETPQGPLNLPAFPASAAGPDLRELVLGSEGRLGILTEATVRIAPLPAREVVHAVFFPDWERAENAARAMVQARLGLSLLRLSNDAETETMLALAGHARPVALLERWLRLRMQRPRSGGKCLLLLGAGGTARQVRRAVRAALALARAQAGVHVGRALGERWKQNRFRSVYLRNAAWAQGYAVDSAETALDWPGVNPAMRAIERAAHEALGAEAERVHVFSHLAHMYPQGASVNATFVYRLAGDFDADLARWRRLKSAVSEAIVAGGGTISHQHGVGLEHARWLAHEKGVLGIELLRAAFEQADPDGRMNPGKLLAP